MQHSHVGLRMRHAERVAAPMEMSYGLNANLCPSGGAWQGTMVPGAPCVYPGAVGHRAPLCEPPQFIELELQRDPIHVPLIRVGYHR